MEPKQISKLQKLFFQSHQTIPLSTRKKALKDLSKSIKENEVAISHALYADLGKSPADSMMTEIGQVYSEIKTMLSGMDRWAGTKYTCSPLTWFPSTSEVQPIPYGNVLIISPWNYPFTLCLCPLVDALAAGNTAVVKPSELAPNTSRVIKEIIGKTFDPEYVAVVEGDAYTTQQLLDEDFDYIFFTGSERVAKIVMEKAAAHLTPVGLELGGKSPAIVDANSNLALAAKRIVWGKFINAGQTCVAPDYVIVEESVKDDLIRLMKHQIDLQVPEDSIGKIINERHFNRLTDLISKSKVLYGGLASAPTLQISPTIIEADGFDEPAMQEEIFGPLLPVLTYTDFYKLMNQLQKRATPLACYLFTNDPLKKEYYREVLPFGGGCINDTVIQTANEYIPFGGMKQSGMGQYHGYYGFMNFSHQKGIMESYAFEIPARYSTLDERIKNLILKWVFRAP